MQIYCLVFIWIIHLTTGVRFCTDDVDLSVIGTETKLCVNGSTAGEGILICKLTAGDSEYLLELDLREEGPFTQIADKGFDLCSILQKVEVKNLQYTNSCLIASDLLGSVCSILGEEILLEIANTTNRVAWLHRNWNATTDTATWNWQALCAGLLADALGMLLVLTCVVFCKGKGNISGLDYDYGIASLEEHVENQASVQGAIQHRLISRGVSVQSAASQQELHRKLSLLSGGHVEGDTIPTSPRLLYPSEVERAQGWQAECTASIFGHANIGRYKKWLVPIIMLISICLFTTANAMDGTAVNLHLKIGKKHFEPITITDFTLVTSIKKMCYAGVYPLAILTFVWSGVWPYIRGLVITTVYILSPKRLSVSSRAVILHMMDIVGKLFFLTNFLSAMMAVAFGFNLNSDTVKYSKWILPKSYVTADVALEPRWGTFGFLLGSVFSLLGGHIVIALHRDALAYDFYSYRLVMQARIEQETTEFNEFAEDEGEDDNTHFVDENDEGFQLAGHQSLLASSVDASKVSWFTLGGESFKSKIHESVCKHVNKCQGKIAGLPCCSPSNYRFLELFVILSVGLSLAFTLSGCWLISFGFNFRGMAGKIIGFMQPSATATSWSVITMLENIGTETVGIVFLQVTLGFLAIGAPLLHLAFLSILWWVPMSLRKQKIVYSITEAVGAWASLDVFGFALCSSLLQMPQFARYLVGSSCYEYLPSSVDCFDVQSTATPNVIILALAILSSYLANYLIMRCADHSILHRETHCLVP